MRNCVKILFFLFLGFCMHEFEKNNQKKIVCVCVCVFFNFGKRKKNGFYEIFNFNKEKYKPADNKQLMAIALDSGMVKAWMVANNSSAPFPKATIVTPAIISFNFNFLHNIIVKGAKKFSATSAIKQNK